MTNVKTRWPGWEHLKQPKRVTEPGDFYFDVDYSSVEARLLAYAALTGGDCFMTPVVRCYDEFKPVEEKVNCRCQAVPIKEEKMRITKEEYDFLKDYRNDASELSCEQCPLHWSNDGDDRCHETDGGCTDGIAFYVDQYEKENETQSTQSYNFTAAVDKIDLGRILRENPDALIIEVVFKRPDRQYENAVALGTKKYREECRMAGVKPDGKWAHFDDKMFFSQRKSSKEKFFVVTSFTFDDVSTSQENVRKHVERALAALTAAKKKRTKVTVNTF